MSPRAGLALAGLGLLLAGACAGPGPRPHVADGPGTPVDSSTVALWRMDETGGVLVADAGPSKLDGRAGPDTRTIFGRFRGARSFTASTNSFIYVPDSPLLDLQDALTLEAWVSPNSVDRWEAQVIAARWTPTTPEHSWLFGIVGYGIQVPTSSPGYLTDLVDAGTYGHLFFTYQPEGAGPPRTFFSSAAVELQRWTQVAVSFDGEVVRFWIDGQPEGTFATRGRIRGSAAPLLIGNLFDPRFLTDFEGELQQGPTADTGTWYAFDGGIDELRLSKVARKSFPVHGGS